MQQLTTAQKSALKVARAGDFERLKELLDGPDIIKDDDKLIAAIHEKKWNYNDHDVISLNYLLAATAGGGHAEMLRYLLDRYPFTGPSIPHTAILNAVDSASTETVKVLLDLDPPINLNGHWNMTGKPLDHALWLDRRQDALRMTEFLLQHGADPNIDGTAIKYALTSSWPELVYILEKYV